MTRAATKGVGIRYSVWKRKTRSLGQLKTRVGIPSQSRVKSRGDAVMAKNNATRHMDEFMQAAIDEARKGLQAGGIPIGSILVLDGKIVGRGHNQRIQRGRSFMRDATIAPRAH